MKLSPNTSDPGQSGDARNSKNHVTDNLASENMIAFCVGQRYPELVNKECRPQVLVSDEGITLILTIDKPTRHDVELFGAESTLEFAVGRVDDILTMAFRFGGKGGFYGLTGYSPHVGRTPSLGDVPIGCGYTLHVLLLDKRGELLKQRLVGLSTEVSRAIREIVRAILRRPFNQAAYERAVKKIERHYTVYELFRRAAATMRVAGSDFTSKTNETELKHATKRRDDDIEHRFSNAGRRDLKEKADLKMLEFLDQVMKRPGPFVHVTVYEMAYVGALMRSISEGVPGAYAGDLIRSVLPDDIAPLYRYVSDCGHSILAIPARFEREAAADERGPEWHEVPLPVRFVLERGYHVLEGCSGRHVVVDCDYDKNVGALVPDGYDDF